MRVPPACLEDKEPCKDWAGLEDGCMVEAVAVSREKKTNETTRDRRFFVSSPCLDSARIARRMLHAIRTHWSIGNRLHSVLDVAFSQDRIQCLNADFPAGKAAISKVALD